MLNIGLRLEMHAGERPADRGSPVNKHVRLKIRRLRLRQGLSSKEAARRSSMPESSYSALENGRSKINLDALLRILIVLEAKVTDVFPSSQADLLSTPDENGCSYILQAVRPAEKRARRGIAAELAAGQPGMTIKALAEAMGCHPSALSHARRRLKERLSSSPGLRRQLEECRKRLRTAGEEAVCD